MVLISALACDITSMRLPNVLTLAGGILVFVVDALAHVQTLQSELFGGIVCFLALGLIHLLSGGRMGLGDAKL